MTEPGMRARAAAARVLSGGGCSGLESATAAAAWKRVREGTPEKRAGVVAEIACSHGVEAQTAARSYGFLTTTSCSG
jgi:hypothetical protein